MIDTEVRSGIRSLVVHVKLVVAVRKRYFADSESKSTYLRSVIPK